MLRTVLLLIFLLTIQSVSAQNEIRYFPLQKGFLSIPWGSPKSVAVPQLVMLTKSRQVKTARSEKRTEPELVTFQGGRFRNIPVTSITLRFDRLYSAKRDGLSQARIVIRENVWRQYPGRKRMMIERLLVAIQADHIELPPAPPLNEMPEKNTYSYGHYDGSYQYSVTLDASSDKEIIVTYSAMAQEEMHGF